MKYDSVRSDVTMRVVQVAVKKVPSREDLSVVAATESTEDNYDKENPLVDRAFGG